MKTDFNNTDANWDRELDRRLSELPDLEAPPSLITRVNAALAKEAATPWWQRPWWFWPVPARIGSFLLLAAAIGLLGVVYLEVRQAVLASYWETALAEWRLAFDPLIEVLNTLERAGEIVARHVCGRVCMAFAGVLLLLYLLTVGLATALYRTLRFVRINP
ncbi:MAG: hypothetical protein H7A46_01070 [Verrucomicrobiales bacterium]|nr:hypothetical protein [Verrucomicrobiales bacterium]